LEVGKGFSLKISSCFIASLQLFLFAHPRPCVGRHPLAKQWARLSSAMLTASNRRTVGSGFQRAGKRSLVDGVIRGSAKAPMIADETGKRFWWRVRLCLPLHTATTFSLVNEYEPRKTA